MNPPRGSRKRKLPKIISRAEAEQILEAALDGTEKGIRDRAMLELLYRAGLRVSEVCKLYPRDVDRDGVIRIYDAKGGDGTSYFDPASVLPHLDRWLEIRKRWIGDGADVFSLFVNRNGRPVQPRVLQRRVKTIKEKLGIRGIVTPHVFRHSYATELIEEGVPVHDVQRLLRHAHLATTAVYLSVRDESLRQRAVNRQR